MNIPVKSVDTFTMKILEIEMNPSMLDNELVQKYFACKDHGQFRHECIANRVLIAMQQPIRKGERYLNLMPNGNIEEGLFSGMIWKDASCEQSYHPHFLRLPSAFQKQTDYLKTWGIRLQNTSKESLDWEAIILHLGSIPKNLIRPINLLAQQLQIREEMNGLSRTICLRTWLRSTEKQEFALFSISTTNF